MRLRWRRRNRRKRCRRHETLVRIARSRESRFARRGAGGEERAGGPRCVRGRGPPSAPARRRAPRGFPQPVYVVSPRGRRDAERGLRKEVRREGPRLARRLGEGPAARSEEHTSELQSRFDLVCRLLLEKKKLYI